MKYMRRNWSADEDRMLEKLLSRGMNYQQIAAHMDRSISSVATRADKLDLSKMGDGTYTSNGVARLLGFSCGKTVVLWIRNGWLPATNISDGTLAAYWRVDQAAVWTFLENEHFWMAWEPERITDPDLRAWAVDLRANGTRWIPTGEACRRLHVTQSGLAGYARSGLIRAVKYGCWYYDESELATFRIPSERPDARRRAA